MGGQAAGKARQARGLFTDRMVKPAVAGAESATTLGRTSVKNGVPEFMKWSAQDAVNEVALGAGQSLAEGGTVTEGVIAGVNEVIVEGAFKTLGMGARKPVSWVGGRVLGSRFGAMRERAKITRGAEEDAAKSRIDFKSNQDLSLIHI